MSNLDYKFPIGFFKKTTKYIAGHLSARAWFREMAKWMNMPTADCSCPTDTVGQPVRVSEGKLQTYFEGEWVDMVVTGTSDTIVMD